MRSFKFFTMILIAGLGVFSCEKKKSSESSESSGTEDLQIMEGLDVDCGGKNCFTADASGTGASTDTTSNTDTLQTLRLSDESPIQTMRMFSWMIVGFPTDEDYASITKGSLDMKNFLPKAGLISKVEDLRKEIVDAAEKTYTDVKSCSDLPIEGSFDTTNGQASWREASATAPTSFSAEKAKKAYDKSITYKSTDGSVEAKYEFFCGFNSVFVVYKTISKGTVKNTFALYYDRETDSELKADFYMLDQGSVGTNDIYLAFMLRTHKAGNVEAWVTRTGPNDSGSGPLGYRYAINADLKHQKISLMQVEEGTNTALTTAQWNAKSEVSSVDVSSDQAPANGSGEGRQVTGCADGWDAVSSEITSAETCDGFDLSEAAAPAVDETGDMSLGWVQSYLSKRISGLSW